MAHNDWCGKPCSDCGDPCKLDQEIPCSPDCENLNPDGSRKTEQCNEAGCDACISDPGVCPNCRHENLSYCSGEVEDGYYIYKWNCEECGSQGRELYRLEFDSIVAD